MKVLVIGSGGREHALAHTFHRQGHTIHCLPGNGGTSMISKPLPEKWQGLNAYDFVKLAEFVKEQQIDLTVVGPEEFLSKGIANVFAQQHLPLFGPTKEAAYLETSKAWAKEFMAKYGIPTAKYAICRDLEESRQALKYLFCDCDGVVIKPSGLTGGKGVVCCDNVYEAEAILSKENYFCPHTEIVLEEKLVGQEISLLAFCDGTTMVPMIPSQDHKRLLDHDEGPNTGGMGAYAPVPFVTEEMMNEINNVVDSTLKALKKEQLQYVGILYFGLMMTKKGPNVLEFNCRFGDPETQALLPLLETDLASVMLACCRRELHMCKLEWKNLSSCCIVMASKGYPGTHTVGQEINVSKELNDNIIIFHAGTKCDDKGRIFSSGGRVLGVTGLGKTLHEAVEQAYKEIDSIDFSNSHYRKDIAYQGLKEEEKQFASRC